MTLDGGVVHWDEGAERLFGYISGRTPV